MNPTHDRGRILRYTTLLHHLCQIPAADPILAVPAYADQNDFDRKRRRLNMDRAPSRTAPVHATEPGCEQDGRSELYSQAEQPEVVLDSP